VWPEILESLAGAGILSMEIYRLQNRLFMVMEVSDRFSFEPRRPPMPQMIGSRRGRRSCGATSRPSQAGRPAAKWRLMERVFDFRL